jgi:hypothetical protein
MTIERDPFQSYVAQNPDTPARTIEGEALVITPHDSMLHTLNPTATFLWDHADGTRTVAQIAALMLAEFEVDEAVLRADLAEFVATAVQRGLLVLTDGPRSSAP